MREIPTLRIAVVLLFVAAAGYPALGQYKPPTDAGALPVSGVDTLWMWKQCREYLTPEDKRGCRIDFDMWQTRNGTLPTETHRDIHVPLGTTMRAVVVLWRSSPFAACSLTTSPGPLARDLSSNIGPALAGLGGFAGSFGIKVEGAAGLAAPPPPPPPQEGLEKHLDRPALPQSILDEEKAITDAVAKFTDHAQPYDNVTTVQKEAPVIKANLFYAYASGGEARAAVAKIQAAAIKIVASALPDGKTLSTLRADRDDLKKKIDKLEKEQSHDERVQAFLTHADQQLAQADHLIETNDSDEVKALTAYLTDVQTKTQKLLDFVDDWKSKDDQQVAANLKPDPSVQTLPIALYPESKVAVTVKCADAVTGTALPDSIQFNAYFQKPPVFDISSGVLISLLPGRQVKVQTPYSDPTAPSACTAATATAPATTTGCSTVVVRRSRPQFMPGVFAEWHPLNFKLPWVHDAADGRSDPRTMVDSWMTEKAPRHALGYVGSLGLAAGFMVNPNSGSAQAEFFEGISFGLQRFVFLAGNHNGRSQNPTAGYTVGIPVGAGTTVPTVNTWSNGLAFGVTYRIPLR